MATELGKAYVQIVPSARGIHEAIREEIGAGSEDAGRSAGTSVANGIKGSIIAAGAGIGAALKSSISAGGALEQSLGGIETLFKESASKVTSYANNAYKTAGLSANTYMETVTSFSASLLQGLGGDTKAAAQYANMAVTDMSDNANKMGTNMETIIQTYQSMARGNYAMLDNLKLGYGGTKKEMERLLEDAEKLTGKKYDMSNLNEVYEAIHAIQGDLGITGTTSKEAATTLEGSFAAMRASAENLLGNMALGKNVKSSLSTLGQTMKTYFLTNLFPAIGNIFLSIPQLVTAAYQAGTQLIKGLTQGFTGNVTQFINSIFPMMVQFSETVRANAGNLISTGLDLILKLAQGIVNGIPTMISTIPTIVTNIAGIINDNAPKILVTGVKIIGTLALGLIRAIPTLIANIPKIIQAIVAVFFAFNWVNLGKQAITGIKNGISAMKGSVKTTATKIKNSIVDAIKSLPGKLRNLGRNAITGIRNALSGGVSTLRGIAGRILSGIVGGIKSLPSKLLEIARSAVSKIKEKFQGGNWRDIGKNIVEGIAKGITGAVGSVISAAKNVISNAINAAKKKAGIKSPSRVFRDEVGQYITQGIAVGVEGDNSAADAIRRVTTGLIQSAKGIATQNTYKPYNGINEDALAEKFAESCKKINFKIVYKNREVSRMVRAYT